MRSAIVWITLVICATLPGILYAQDETPPVPPAREHKVGDVVVEEGPKVVAEEPAEKPAAQEPPAKPETPPKEPTPEPAPAEPAKPPAVPGRTPMEETRKTAIEDIQAVETRPERPATVAPPDVDDLKKEPSIEKPIEMQVPPARPVPSNLGEVELVERVAVAREAYRLALEALKQHYVSASNATKMQWAEKELAAFEAIDRYHYLSEIELAGPDLKPIASIAAADQLFTEGMEFKNYPAFPPEKKDKLRIAIQKFRTIISDYPTSDKIDDAAFRMGEIYEGWYYQDFSRAVICYERCFQWNPRTTYPARFYAARLYDQKLMQRDKAVELYNLVVLEDLNPQHVEEAARRLKELGPKR